MSAQWYCRQGGKASGPFTSEQLRQLARSGKIRPETEVCRGDSGGWAPAAKVQGLFEEAAGAAASRGGGIKRPAMRPQIRNLPTAAPSPSSSVRPKPRSAASGPAATAVAPAPVPAASPAAQVRAIEPQGEAVAAPIHAEPAAGEDSSILSRTRRRRTRGPLIAVIVVLVLAAGGGVAAIIATGGSGDDQNEQAAEGPAGKGQDDASDPKPAPEAKPKPVDPRVAFMRARAGAAWREAGGRITVKKGDAAIRVEDAYLANDSGQRVTQPDASQATKLIVEVLVQNRAKDQPLQFTSWAAPEANSPRAAIAVDDQFQLLKPAAAAPVAEPKKSLAPGEEFRETLVFTAPRPDFAHVRLALPYAAVDMKDHSLWSISRELVLSENASPLAIAGSPKAGGVANKEPADSKALQEAADLLIGKWRVAVEFSEEALKSKLGVSANDLEERIRRERAHYAGAAIVFEFQTEGRFRAIFSHATLAIPKEYSGTWRATGVKGVEPLTIQLQFTSPKSDKASGQVTLAGENKIALDAPVLRRWPIKLPATLERISPPKPKKSGSGEGNPADDPDLRRAEEFKKVLEDIKNSRTK